MSCGTVVEHQLDMTRSGSVRVCGLAVVLLLFLARVARADSLTLAWDPNPETDVQGYVLSWGTQPGVYVTHLDVGNHTSAQATGLADRTAYYFVVQAHNSYEEMSLPSVEVSRRVGIPISVPGDFLGDFRSSLTVFRPSVGAWLVWESGGAASYVWGGRADIPVAGDYDGDGKADVAV